MSEKTFNGTIHYLQIVTCIGAAMCFMQMILIGFDPFQSMDALIWNDLYGTAELPAIAKPAFTLPFQLFCFLSVLTMLLVFLITKYALAKKEAWAFWAIVLVGVFWPIGSSLITWYTAAWSYFISVGMMTLLFLPPVILLYPYFRPDQAKK